MDFNTLCTEYVVDTRIVVGDIVRHFKREMLDPKEDKLQYLYRVEDIAYDCNHNNYVVVYKALYEDPLGITPRLYVRELKDFYSEVDHKKYPNIKQKYRFERV